VIEWGKVPWSLWAFAALAVAPAILIEIQVSGPIASKVLFALVMLAWLFFLLKGVRWVWIGTLGICVLGFAGDLISGSLAWHGVVLGLISPALLLLPVTRRYFANEPESAAT
jgi:hypothetical protein